MYSKEKKGLSSWKKLKNNWEDNDLKRIWDVTASYKGGYEPDVEEGMGRFRQRIAKDSGRKRVFILNRIGAYWQIAAAILLLLGAGYLFTTNFYQPATTLEALSTRENQKKEITLDDGTTVKLNEQSELTFPPHFDKERRRVQLKGEGFFDVASDAERPFLIETSGAGIRVVGTAFNVRSYDDESFIEVFVKEGEVKVTIKEIGERYTLRAGEKLNYKVRSGNAEVATDKQGNVLAWDTGTLNFRGQPFSEVRTSMERLYHIAIDVEDPSLLSCPITTKLEVGKMNEMIEVLESLCPLHFEKNTAGNYTLRGKCCN